MLRGKKKTGRESRNERFGDQIFGAAVRSVSNDRGSVHRDYQFAGHFESSQGNRARGRELYDVLESYVRKGFFALDKKERQDGRDIMWYIWLHPGFTIVWKE